MPEKMESKKTTLLDDIINAENKKDIECFWRKISIGEHNCMISTQKVIRYVFVLLLWLIFLPIILPVWLVVMVIYLIYVFMIELPIWAYKGRNLWTMFDWISNWINDTVYKLFRFYFKNT